VHLHMPALPDSARLTWNMLVEPSHAVYPCCVTVQVCSRVCQFVMPGSAICCALRSRPGLRAVWQRESMRHGQPVALYCTGQHT